MTGPSFRTLQLQVHGPRVRFHMAANREFEEGLAAAGLPCPEPVPMVGLIDTGASHSVVRSGTAKLLGAAPQGILLMATAGGDRHPCPSLRARARFGPGVEIPLTIGELPLAGDGIDALLGRDVLAHGRMIYDGREGAVALVLKGMEIGLPTPGSDLPA